MIVNLLYKNENVGFVRIEFENGALILPSASIKYFFNYCSYAFPISIKLVYIGCVYVNFFFSHINGLGERGEVFDCTFADKNSLESYSLK